MSASKYIKAQGLPDLQYVADKVGKHRDTINNWYHKEPRLFDDVVLAEKVKLMRERFYLPLMGSDIMTCRVAHGSLKVGDSVQLWRIIIELLYEREDDESDIL